LIGDRLARPHYSTPHDSQTEISRNDDTTFFFFPLFFFFDNDDTTRDCLFFFFFLLSLLIALMCVRHSETRMHSARSNGKTVVTYMYRERGVCYFFFGHVHTALKELPVPLIPSSCLPSLIIDEMANKPCPWPWPNGDQGVTWMGDKTGSLHIGFLGLNSCTL
jgi:hypothetical protein